MVEAAPRGIADLLDVGCGPATLRSLLPRGIDYFGVDIADEVIRALHDPSHFEVVDLNETPACFDGRRFDAIVCSGTFEYIRDPVSYSDPFGLCPQGLSGIEQSLCKGIENTMMVLGAIGGGISGGGEGAVLALPTGETAGIVTIPAGAILQGVAGAAAGKLWGMALTNVLFSSGYNSRTTARTKIGKQTVRVDAELPTDHSPGEVHVQSKGPGGPQKYLVSGVDDLSGLPKSIRENSIIQRGIEKAFDLINRFQP